MDFLKNLKIEDNRPHSSGTTDVSAHNTGTNQEHQDDRGLLHKISDALNPNHPADRPDNASKVHHEEQHSSAPPREEGLLDKIGSAISAHSHSHSEASAQPHPPPPQPAPAHHSEHLLNKISDALGGGASEFAQKPPASQMSEPPKQQHHSEALLNKIGSALGGKTTPPPPPPPPAPKEEGLLDKIGSVLGGHGLHHEQQQQQLQQEEPHGLGSVLGKIVGHQDEPPKPQSLGDKINNALGGGTAGEKKEGKLDKAIDFVQEHVLKQGPQDNETALEQLKDKQIADAIRHQFKNVTGKDMPSSHHDEK